MAVTTIKDRIKDLAGSDMNETTFVSYDDVIRNAVNFIIDLIPATSELWHHQRLPKDEIIGDTTEFDNKRILSVKRKSSDNGKYYPCREVSLKRGIQFDDPVSIFYAVRDYRNPLFYINEVGQVVVRPVTTAGAKATVYYVDYLTLDNAADISGYTQFGGNSATEGIPEIVMDIICLRAAILLLQARVSNAVQDDEDTELLQLLQGQIASLNALFQEEAQRLNIPYKRMGVSDDIK